MSKSAKTTGSVLNFFVKFWDKLLLHLFNFQRILTSESAVFRSFLFLLQSHLARTSANITMQVPSMRSAHYGIKHYQNCCLVFSLEPRIVSMNISAQLECVQMW